MPKLASRIAAISNITSTIDMTLATLLAAFMGAEAAVGMAIYNAVDSEGAKLAILRTAANRFLDADGMAKFTKLLGDLKKGRRERNDAIHGMWGYAPKHPDSLIWIDPRDLQTYMAELTEGVVRRAGVNSPNPPWEKALVYKEQDFIDIENRLMALHQAVATFYRVMLGHIAQAR